MIELRPIGVREASVVVRQLHRHLPRVVGGLFAVAAWQGNQLIGVAVASVPRARLLQDGTTVEITRLATNGASNACSRLYGAICRAAGAIGYRKAITYTLPSEPGTSLIAAGFHRCGTTREQTWNRPNRHRIADRIRVNRWMRLLNEPRASRLAKRNLTSSSGNGVP